VCVGAGAELGPGAPPPPPPAMPPPSPGTQRSAREAKFVSLTLGDVWVPGLAQVPQCCLLPGPFRHGGGLAGDIEENLGWKQLCCSPCFAEAPASEWQWCPFGLSS
jgi:hypothetical protein